LRQGDLLGQPWPQYSFHNAKAGCGSAGFSTPICKAPTCPADPDLRQGSKAAEPFDLERLSGRNHFGGTELPSQWTPKFSAAYPEFEEHIGGFDLAVAMPRLISSRWLWNGPAAEISAFIARSLNKYDGTTDIREHRTYPFVVWRGQCKHVRRVPMNNRFMMSVATAALIASSGLAYSQGANPNAGGASTPSAQQSAPGGAKEGMSKDGMKDSAQSKDGMSKEAPKSAQSKDSPSKDGMKDSAQSKDGMSKEAPKSAQSKDGMSKDGVNAQTKGTTADTKAGATTDTKSGTTADTKSGVTTDTKSGTTADTKSGATGSQTTGNAATSATAAPPAEKRTQIVSAIRSESSIKETTNVNFNISVGTRVPSSVHFYPLPPRIVEIYPEWRGYQVILVKGRYVIVRPQTYEIVYIIEG
jgi:hypothetical protein